MSDRIARQRLVFSKLAPAGYYLGLRIRFIAAENEFIMLPPSLMQSYSTQGLALNDPLMRWAFRNSGSVRWKDLAASDPADVLSEYRRHGLSHGAVVSILTENEGPLRSIGIFARNDRDYEEPELSNLQRTLDELHEPPGLTLTQPQIEALRLLAAGYRYKQISQILGITESAVKARLKAATLRVEARTPAQALKVAVAAGLLHM
ncbi:helix-turn-helix transcriptional regulator [Cereibacter sphaeroides]|uniref:helix-turn-helix transcriptional regulator n=1 Tax=Cereibacter sphaeroides TaxID=1063 RepID=UPI001F1EEF80|nr:autoinducer binding domain-containing protein [Cereibacter sphaeroides]MCE6967449.1 autoinducer binding domain-containing protein [Cereibacter sphaeroides]